MSILWNIILSRRFGHIPLPCLRSGHVFGIREHCVHAVSGELLLSGRYGQAAVSEQFFLSEGFR
ncbi:MAG: hypothetical protein LBT92_03695, partial [Rickettsiales bacterium]|nr:hypothetical protein [Rickettsiales bacterium]